MVHPTALLAACTDVKLGTRLILPAGCTRADPSHGTQIHLQRLALSAGHTAYKERLEELHLLKLHLKNASREASPAWHTGSAAHHTAPSPAAGGLWAACILACLWQPAPAPAHRRDIQIGPWAYAGDRPCTPPSSLPAEMRDACSACLLTLPSCWQVAVLRTSAQSVDVLKGEVQHLGRQLQNERAKATALSEELETPLNVHR